MSTFADNFCGVLHQYDSARSMDSLLSVESPLRRLQDPFRLFKQQVQSGVHLSDQIKSNRIRSAFNARKAH